MLSRRKPQQLPLAKTAGWGGKRQGAGRKPRGEVAGVPHRRRERVTRHTPVHVTMRVLPDVRKLRSHRSLPSLRRALAAGGRALGLRLCEFSIQGNHVHLIVEASSNRVLSRGMQSLAIRVAKTLNHLLRRKGKVLSDRFHSHVLTTRAEIRNAVRYVRENADEHRRRTGQWVIGWADEFSSAHPDNLAVIVDALGHLLKQVQRRLRPPPGVDTW